MVSRDVPGVRCREFAQLLRLCETERGAAALACSLLERGPIALLVNNAGVMGGSYAETMAVNAIAPAVLSIGLMPQLAQSKSPRIVNVASSAHLRAGRVSPREGTFVRVDSLMGRTASMPIAIPVAASCGDALSEGDEAPPDQLSLGAGGRTVSEFSRV